VAGHNVIIVDDEIDTAGTLCKAAAFVRAAGAREVVACATHAIFSEPAPDRVRESVLREVVVCDTVALSEEQRRRSGDKVCVLPVAPLLAEVIERIHIGRSVGELFNE
jgi:ribose-phosphate pyrophosphokinase